MFWPIAFLVIALICYALGFLGVAAGAAAIFKIGFFAFLTAFIVALLMSVRR